MKTAMLALCLLLLGVPVTEASAGVSVSFGVFYSSLSPHGEWIAVDGGAYAWRPFHVVHGWRPYSVGRWIWTDDGWYWASAEPWGWATYHYGRWYYDEYYGWVWIPGYDWSPAWVEWRYGGDFFGWAPLGPYAVFNVHSGVHYPHRWVTPDYYWSFVSCRNLTHDRIDKYVYKRNNNARYVGQTRSTGSVRVDGGRIMTSGPDRSDVERQGKIRISRADIVDVEKRGTDRIVRSGNHPERIEVYRPSIQVRRTQDGSERPEKVRGSKRTVAVDSRNSDVHLRTQELMGRGSPHESPSKRDEQQGRDRQKADPPSVPPGRHGGDGAHMQRTPAPSAERVQSGRSVENTPVQQNGRILSDRAGRQPGILDDVNKERGIR